VKKIIILNCEEIIITGNKKNIEENFEIRRSRVGHSQKGPKTFLNQVKKMVKKSNKRYAPRS